MSRINWSTWLTRHASKIPDGFHEITDWVIMGLYATRAMRALQRAGTVDGIAQELSMSPYDWYWVPHIVEEDDKRRWMRISWIEEIKEASGLARILSWSIGYTIEYMTRKGYYIPQKIRNCPSPLISGVVKYFAGLSWFSQEKDIEAVSIFLKFLRATYQAFTLKKQNGNHVFNSETWEIRTINRYHSLPILDQKQLIHRYVNEYPNIPMIPLRRSKIAMPYESKWEI